MLENIIRLLEDRLDYSVKYFDEYYPEGNRLDNSEATDSASWEIGFYEGITYALNTINQELERKRVEQQMVGNKDV